jgi:SAM-dependent methyltransferase
MNAANPRTRAAGAVIWHDVECGAYDADLAMWERLVVEYGGPVLELGCGTGRVALHLATRGHDVTGVDRDADLVDAARERAAERNLELELVTGDVRELRLERTFSLSLAPMQLIQLVGGAEGRRRALDAIARHLSPGGALAAAIVEGEPAAAIEDGASMLPDVREHDGWIYSSLPLEVVALDGRLVVRRLRQTVAPDGALSEAIDTVELDVITAAELEAEARDAGLMPAGRLDIEPTEAHVGSTVVLLERERTRS